MRIAGIVRDSIVDGVGIRDVIFTQGCPHRCEGCHNQVTWAYDTGFEKSAYDIHKSLKNSTNNITISGGEPILQWADVMFLAKLFRTDGKTIWLYTGYEYETLSKEVWKMFADSGVEVVVDGRFEIDKRDPNLLFRGSSNQRLIDLPKTIEANRIIEWEDNR